MRIAVVGCDGAGKSSVTKFLRGELDRHGLSVGRIDKWDVVDPGLHPGYDFMRPDLPKLRRRVSDMQAVTRTFFLFWTLHGTMLPSRMEGKQIILLDGYWPKHAASELLYSRCEALVEAAVALMPPVDLTVFLDVDPLVAYERRIADVGTPLVPYECGLDPELRRESFLAHQKACRAILNRWSDTFGWSRIDADRSAEAVRRDALALLSGCGVALAGPAASGG